MADDDFDEPRFLRADGKDTDERPAPRSAHGGWGATVVLGIVIFAAIFLSDANVRRDLAKLLRWPPATASQARTVVARTATLGRSEREDRRKFAYALNSTLGCEACPGGSYARIVAISVWDGGPLPPEGEEAFGRLTAAGFPEAFESRAGIYATTSALFQFHAGQFIEAVTRAAADQLVDEEERADR